MLLNMLYSLTVVAIKTSQAIIFKIDNNYVIGTCENRTLRISSK